MTNENMNLGDEKGGSFMSVLPVAMGALERIRFSIFHGPTYALQNTPLKTRIFEEWHGFWSNHFKETDNESNLFSDDFTRAKYITVLHTANTPVAMILASPWNLASPVHLRSRYLGQYPAHGIEHFHALNLRRILSMEYFYLHPEWRFQQTQMPWSEVIIGLALKVFLEDKELDAAVAIARRAVKSQNRTASWGMRELFPMNLHQNECSLVWCAQGDPLVNSDQLTEDLTRHFWLHQQRVGFPRYESHESFPDLKVA